MLQEVTPLKYPPVLFDSSQIDQAGTRLKLCTSSPLNDESSFMLCSLANTWVEAPTLNTSETQQQYPTAQTPTLDAQLFSKSRGVGFVALTKADPRFI
jgi:surface antigen